MRGIGRQLGGATALLLASLLMLVPFVVADGEAGLVGAVLAVAVLAWAGRSDLPALRAVATVATTPARAARQVEHRVGVPRQCDPDAAGRPRPRAPGLLRPEQTQV